MSYNMHSYGEKPTNCYICMCRDNVFKLLWKYIELFGTSNYGKLLIFGDTHYIFFNYLEKQKS